MCHSRCRSHFVMLFDFIRVSVQDHAVVMVTTDVLGSVSLETTAQTFTPGVGDLFLHSKLKIREEIQYYLEKGT